MKTINSVTTLVLFVATVLIITTGESFAQTASPLQGGHYAAILQNTRDMANPPSGLFVLWYNSFFSSNKYYDKNGDPFEKIRLDQIHPALPDIDVSLKADGLISVPGIFWATDLNMLGGAKYMTGISQGYLSMDALALTEMRGIVIDTIRAKETGGSVSGLTDLFVVPLGLSWSLDKFDFTFLYGFYTPTGAYTSGSSDNTGLGFWSNQFQGYSYFYPIADKSSALMVGLTYELNSKIKDAEVTPGNRFTLEWGLSQFLSEKFEVGIQGGHNWQISDDSGDDVYWDPAIHDRKNSISFNASYWPIKERLMINLKYGLDYGMIQRFKNQSYMLNLIYVPNILNGKQ